MSPLIWIGLGLLIFGHGISAYGVWNMKRDLAMRKRTKKDTESK